MLVNNFTNTKKTITSHLNSSNTKKTTHEVGKPGPGLREAQKCGRVKSVNPYCYCAVNL